MNKIANLIQEKENSNFKFMPDMNFYKQIEIGRKRWGQLLRNEKSPTLEELQRIANYFNVSITELIEV